MTSYRGLPACTCLAAWLPVFEDMIGREVTWWQLAGDAPASAGFHSNGGSADCPPLSEAELRTARNMGAAAWNRWWSGNDHAHMRLNGCPHNTIAQRQVTDLNEGRDGTGSLNDNYGPADNGPRDGVHWPLRTWQEGIDWANNQRVEDWFEMATREELKQVVEEVIRESLAKAIIPTEPRLRDGSYTQERFASVLRRLDEQTKNS